MDFYKVPIGFGMALAMNAPAMEAYAAMTEQQKQAVLNKAHNARSEKEMHQIVASLAGGGSMQWSADIDHEKIVDIPLTNVAF